MDQDSSSKFIGSLTKFLQSLCNGYVEFQRGVELVGHIYLNIDTGEKVDYVLHEKVSKNDENSVSFVSNSFHAQPQDKRKEKANKDSRSSVKSSADKSDNDDSDIMIVDQPGRVIGSTNSGSVPSRGVKRMAPGPDHRQFQRPRNQAYPSPQNQNNSGHPYTSINRQQSGRPATVTSQGGSQQNENLNISDVKLEQISQDELLTLASQVGEGAAGSHHSSTAASHSQSQPQQSAMAGGSSRGEGGVWVKQEKVDDDGGGGWSQERDESNSNSSSSLYPVMLHQNPGFQSSSSSFPGFPGQNTSVNQSAANPFPMPGTSQDMSNIDPSVTRRSHDQHKSRMEAQHGHIIPHFPVWQSRPDPFHPASKPVIQTPDKKTTSQHVYSATHGDVQHRSTQHQSLAALSSPASLSYYTHDSIAAKESPDKASSKLSGQANPSSKPKGHKSPAKHISVDGQGKEEEAPVMKHAQYQRKYRARLRETNPEKYQLERAKNAVRMRIARARKRHEERLHLYSGGVATERILAAISAAAEAGPSALPEDPRAGPREEETSSG